MTDSSHAYLGIRLPDTRSGGRTGPVSLTCQLAAGNHVGYEVTQVPLVRNRNHSGENILTIYFPQEWNTINKSMHNLVL